MRKIDLENWPRRAHFEMFSAFAYPHFNLCANVDITEYYSYLKNNSLPINIAIIYIMTYTANTIPEFRQRIRENEVVEHALVHPSSTILADDDVFSYCTLDYHADFTTFKNKAEGKIAAVKKQPRLQEEDAGRDDLLFMTSIPWVSFTSISHPIYEIGKADSIPRLSWGKFFKEGKRLKMPLSVQGNHALMDGLHAGRFFTVVQGYLDAPENVLES